MTDQNPYGQQPGQPGQPAYQQPEPPKKKPFYKRIWFIILVVIVLIAIIASVSSGGDDDKKDDAGSGSNGGDSSTSQDSGAAQLGETVSLKKADITASNLRPSSDAIGQYVCADVNFVVTGDESININGLMDWKLTDPNGATMTQTVGGETDYDSVELAPGGTRAGTVCFDAPGTPGAYKLSYEEGLSFSSDKAEWDATL
ncbi:DUF4352 domain-containing protein [uncultured Corynebacterium sp.]|uniref:DUF4352 domain-containing protein n=1 Tax=uncultured Corynebacterium sp. TaxID=159447 RepID=UPI0025D21A05|nr:DUF4352 domain-containing protein [uncultured Corynebacterium sp.]